MQGSEQWHANNINGQVVHTKPPYPGVGRCSVQLIPCPFPVSANDVSMSPVVAPGRDAALMEFEEASIEFLSPQLPADFSTVRWDTPLGEITAPGSPLGEGDEAVVKPSHVGVCDVVPPLVVWEELFNASEAWFADGLSGVGVVQEGKGERRRFWSGGGVWWCECRRGVWFCWVCWGGEVCGGFVGVC